MHYNLYILLILLFVFSCEPSSKEKSKKETIYVDTSKSYTISKLSDNARKEIDAWNDFRSLYHIMKHLSPNNILFQEDNSYQNDSLLLYKRLYPKNASTIKNNIFVDKDWHTPAKASDTIYRITCDDKNFDSSLQWEESLTKDAFYQLSLFSCKSNSSEMIIRVKENNEDYKSVINQKFNLDSLENTNYSNENDLLKWKKISVVFSPKHSGKHIIDITLPYSQSSETSPSVLLVSPVIKIKNQEINLTINDNKNSVKSVLLWLDRMDDEIHYLLTENQIPQKLNTPALISRIKWVQTQIKLLNQEIQNQSITNTSNFSEKIIGVAKSFNSVINLINTICNDYVDAAIEKNTNNKTTTKNKEE